MELYEIRTSGSGEGWTDNGRMTDGSGEQLTFGSGEPKKVS